MDNERGGDSVLLLLFAAGGCAALIYEIVWFQLLELVVGSSAVSLAVLLGVYMGGLAAGSASAPRLVRADRHPLRAYAALEAGIGLCGLAILAVFPSLMAIYAAVGGAGVFLRAALAAVVLLPPTVLMGATLPVAARWVEDTPRGASRVGLFYGANTAGAVGGCLLAGFYLLRVHDAAAATLAAAALNGTVAVGALALASRAGRRPPAAAGAGRESPPGGAVRPGRASILIAIGLSGAAALGAEVVWTRLLSLLLGGTVYTFSIILAVFLAGIGLGGGLGSVLARRAPRPRFALAAAQLALAAATAWTAMLLSRSLPYWPIHPSLGRSPWSFFQLDLLRCLWALLPAACLWGLSFPLALAASGGGGRNAGRTVGRVYAANTLGAIAGALGFGLGVIPALGTQNAQRCLIGLSTAAALAALAPAIGSYFRRRTAPPERRVEAVGGAGLIAFAAALGLAALLARTVGPTPWRLIAYGRSLPTRTTASEPLFVGEGMTSSVAVTRLENGTRNFHVGGKVEASSDPQDMRLQRMLGHLPALLHPNPRSVLVVGCGAGVTAGSFLAYPGLERLVICEIEPLIPKAVARRFERENAGVLDDPRVRVVIDDARHFILTCRERFDVITSDPIHPWVKGSAALYTREYFELCRRRLRPGGRISQWVPFYESTEAAVKSEIATFFSVFPEGTVWGNDMAGLGYDVVLLGGADGTAIDLDALEARLGRPAYGKAAASLAEVGFRSAIGLLASFAGDAPGLESWLRDAAVNRDRNLRLQYLAGLGLNLSRSIFIYDDMLSRRRFPRALVRGSARTLEDFRKAAGFKP